MSVGFLIGRFQVPEPHEGHRFLFNSILQQQDELLILVGSANRARSPKNPFTFSERKAAIYKVLTQEQAERTIILPLNDYLYSNSQWMADVAATVAHFSNVTMYGHFKEGNDYLKWFPQFKFVNIQSTIDISGTEIRNSFKHMLPASVQEDMAYLAKEANKFENYPYRDSLNINCGDSVVECLGHVLLIKRGANPGRGNWALPGGHKHTYETFEQCALRELTEETNLRVPEKVLKGSIVSRKMFDNPARSSGIPKSTMALHIRIESNTDGSFPRISPKDDAVEARWVPISEALNDLSLHDDHGDIISDLTGVKPMSACNNPRFF